MSRTKKAYKERPVTHQILSYKPQTLAHEDSCRTTLIHQRTKQLTQGGAWEEQGRALPEATLAIAKHRLNRATIARSPSTVSFNVSLQNGFPLSSTSCRVKPHHVSCSVSWAWACPSWRPWRLSTSLSPTLLSQRSRRPILSRRSWLDQGVPLHPIKSWPCIRSPTTTV
jgi:hypothetical protein